MGADGNFHHGSGKENSPLGRGEGNEVEVEESELEVEESEVEVEESEAEDAEKLSGTMGNAWWAGRGGDAS